MTIPKILPQVQAIRQGYENGQPSTASTTFHIDCYQDPSSGKDIILWDDIIAVFSGSLYARSETGHHHYLKGPDNKK